jgi:predicted phosphodiesterase
VRIAVISDVHSNVVALDAVLDALRPFDAVWHLGDVVGYGPHPVEAIERLAAAQALSVMGNHDAAVLGAISTDWFNDDARAAIEWTADRLTPAARHWLQALPEKLVEDEFTLVHGSPREPLFEYLMSRAAARPSIEMMDTPHGLVGHSHIPLAFRQEDGNDVSATIAIEGTSVEIGGRRVIANPGSVGQPRDGDFRASAALFDRDAGTLTWHRVEYDVEQVQAAMRAVKLPKRLVERLSRGR